jgi:hypothetical protein
LCRKQLSVGQQVRGLMVVASPPEEVWNWVYPDLSERPGRFRPALAHSTARILVGRAVHLIPEVRQHILAAQLLVLRSRVRPECSVLP